MEKKVSLLIAEGKIEEAVAALEQDIQREPSEEKLLLLGELFYNQGRSIEALNKFNAVLKLNSENTKASAYVKMINDILNFYHKDLLNP